MPHSLAATVTVFSPRMVYWFPLIMTCTPMALEQRRNATTMIATAATMIAMRFMGMGRWARIASLLPEADVLRSRRREASDRARPEEDRADDVARVLWEEDTRCERTPEERLVVALVLRSRAKRLSPPVELRGIHYSEQVVLGPSDSDTPAPSQTAAQSMPAEQRFSPIRST